MRIVIATSTLNSMKDVLSSKTFSLQVMLGVLKCCVWSVVLYRCETWIIGGKMLKMLEVWFLRRVMRTSWTSKITNEQILQGINTRLELIGDIVKRNEQENVVLTGYAEDTSDSENDELQWNYSV